MKPRRVWQPWLLLIATLSAVAVQICLMQWWDATTQVLQGVTLVMLAGSGIALIATTIALVRGGGSIEE